ncbi:hypothetical protein LIER_21679 [Lithospermum erythrorhizon]|uniref:Uncharacterized protein n=1 Tax=Lithospermum erythrorhizon TaxID=34254 RepID=A0AAV3QV92_LITER
MDHPKSTSALTKTTKHKADAHAFSTYWEDKPSMPLHFYTDRRVLKAAGPFPPAGADLGVLEVLRVSFSVPDHALLPPSTAPVSGPNQLPLRQPTPTFALVVVRSSSKEDEAMSPHLRRPCSSTTGASVQNPDEAALQPQDMGADTPLGPERNSSSSSPLSPRDQRQGRPSLANPASVAAQESVGGQYSATEVLEPEDQRGVGSTIPLTPSSVPLPTLEEPRPKGPSISPLGNSPVPPEKFFGLHGMVLQSYKDLLSSYEAPSGSSSRVGQLEGELKALKDEKAREEGVLQCHLKNLTGEHSILEKRYGANVRRVEAVRTSLEGVQAERDSAMMERDVAAQVLKATLEGIWTADGLEELVQSSDTGCDQLLKHLSRTLERTIRVVQAKLEEVELEMPSSF